MTSDRRLLSCPGLVGKRELLLGCSVLAGAVGLYAAGGSRIAAAAGCHASPLDVAILGAGVVLVVSGGIVFVGAPASLAASLAAAGITTVGEAIAIGAIGGTAMALEFKEGEPKSCVVALWQGVKAKVEELRDKNWGALK